MPSNKTGPYVHRPDRVLVAPSDLPPANTRRWVQRRKAVVVAAIETGLLTFEVACRRYNLSAEELTAWRLALKKFGAAGLSITKTHQHTKNRSRRK